MLINKYHKSLNTPAFIYDETKILKNLTGLTNKLNNDCFILFPLKSFALIDALHLIAPMVSGFSVSSLYESKLANDVLGSNKVIHLTTPGLKLSEFETITELCNYISYNSLSQWKVYHDRFKTRITQGLRINPQLSFVKDERYDPCRRYSKLGIPVTDMTELNNNVASLSDISGIHFHTNCESRNFRHLLKTINYIETQIPNILKKIHWINFGGGYLFEGFDNLDPLLETICYLKNKFELDIFFEPGKGIVGNAGYIVSTVVDLFLRDNREIAILDTSVNHMPEVFEYQYKPDVIGGISNGENKYILAGASCLAGDIFGEYQFNQPLEVGSRIIFKGIGAYSLVKANMFNGINLPTIYSYTLKKQLQLKKQFNYEDFTSRCGVKKNVTE